MSMSDRGAMILGVCLLLLAAAVYLGASAIAREIDWAGLRLSGSGMDVPAR
jgi:hypothetical protein